jgi:hypothetical protein
MQSLTERVGLDAAMKFKDQARRLFSRKAG